MAYLDIYGLRTSQNLHNRVVVGVVSCVATILSESAGTARHAERVVWAYWALQNTSVAADQLLWGVLTDATIAAAGEAATDAQLQTRINAIVNYFLPTAPVVNTVADGTYTIGAKLTTNGANGSITITNGVISAITQAS